jgi:hypothetical protein
MINHVNDGIFKYVAFSTAHSLARFQSMSRSNINSSGENDKDLPSLTI